MGNVLVTGASGFIGGALARRLIDMGENVTCLVRTKNSEVENKLKGSTIYEGDVSSYHLMCEIISSQEIDVIFHLAAYAIVRISARDPLTTYETNVMGTVTILEAARNVGKCRKIVIASSDKAYGDHDILPYTEKMALQPKNTYDTSKACADLIARSYAHNYNMPVVVTRCSNVYGPGDPNDSRIIPNSIKRILAGKLPMLYSDVSMMEREFIYIDDVVDAYIAIAETGFNTDGMAFNIGGTFAEKVENVAKLIMEQMGVKGSPEIVQRENIFKEIKRQYIDASLLKSYTGWRPKTYLSDGLRNTITWYVK